MPDPGHKGKHRMAWGVVLVAIGLVFLADELFGIDLLARLWPIALIAAGAYLIWGEKLSLRDNGGTGAAGEGSDAKGGVQD